jgi:hypothetical protein
VLTHIAGDILTPTGIKLYHPLTPREIVSAGTSETKYTLDVVKASNETANDGLLSAGILFTCVVVYISI